MPSAKFPPCFPCVINEGFFDVLQTVPQVSVDLETRCGSSSVEHVSCTSRPRNSTRSTWRDRNRSSFSNLNGANDLPPHVPLRTNKDSWSEVKREEICSPRIRSSRNCMRKEGNVPAFHVFQRAHLSRISSARDFSTRGFQSARFCRLLPLRGKSCKGNLVPFRQELENATLLVVPSFLNQRNSTIGSLLEGDFLSELRNYWVELKFIEIERKEIKCILKFRNEDVLDHLSKSKNQYEFLLEMEDLKIIKLNKNYC